MMAYLKIDDNTYYNLSNVSNIYRKNSTIYIQSPNWDKTYMHPMNSEEEAIKIMNQIGEM